MVIWTARFSKRKAVLLVVILGLVTVGIILLAGNKEEPVEEQTPLVSDADRAAYLQSWGWEVSAEPVETLRVQLPEALTEWYQAYNALQQTQGFDLTDCCGKQLERYTYRVSNYPGRPDGIQANLYLCDGLPVAGDICCPGASGFQQGLAYPGAQTDS